MSKKRNKSIRKILAVAMAAAICAGTGLMTPVGNFIGTNTVVSAAETYGNFEYEINDDNTVTITNYNGSDTEVTIPSKINGKSVTSIGEYVFSWHTELTSVTIPDTIISIGVCAFANCTGLESLEIPNSVTYIGDAAFNSSGFISITMSENVTSIGDSTFNCCTNLESITIPDGVTTIGRSAFANCEGLKSVKIPNSVTKIEDYAFDYCPRLKSVKIPNSVTSIGDYAFYYCTDLASITIPDSVTSIGDCVFNYCEGLTSVTIPDSVTSIGYSTFERCTGLRSITIPNSVTSIEDVAFYGCTNLTSITIPDSVTSIGDYSFENCTNLTIYGQQGSYAETYANEKNIPFGLVLSNNSEVSADEINPGETVTVNANASGGNGDYTYAVLYKKTTDSKWIVKQNYKANSNISIKPETAGTYDICVKVKDGNGNIEKKYFTVKVLGELENNSELSETEITLGDTITATAQGEGGTGEYTYAVLYKKKNDTKWTVKQNYKTNSIVTIKPAHSVEYDVCIKVKDGDGKIVKKYFTVNVKKPALANGSAVSSSSITLGNTITVKATATGGTTPYTYAVYTKKSTTSKWTENQAYSTNSSVNFKPTEKGTYNICVKVKDKAGTVEKKYLTVTVK